MRPAWLPTLAELQKLWYARNDRLSENRARLTPEMVTASRLNRLREAELCAPHERMEARRQAMGWAPPEPTIY